MSYTETEIFFKIHVLLLQNSAFRCSPRHFYADIVGARERKNKRIRHISLSSTGGLLGLHFRKTWKKGMFNIVLHRCFSQHCLFYIYVFRSCSFESYSLSSFIQDSSCFTFQRIIFCSFLLHHLPDVFSGLHV